MRPISEIKANYRLRIVSSGEDGFAAYINHPCYKPTAILARGIRAWLAAVAAARKMASTCSWV